MHFGYSSPAFKAVEVINTSAMGVDSAFLSMSPQKGAVLLIFGCTQDLTWKNHPLEFSKHSSEAGYSCS